MNTHPSESLPAYVLGALDADEAFKIAEHLRDCSACRDEAEEFRAIVGLLPYCVPAQDPPAHLKRQLFARISAAADTHHIARVTHAQSLARPAGIVFAPRWMSAITALSLLMALVMGGMLFESRLSIARREQEIASFLSSRGTVGHPLTPPRPNGAISAKMYMQKGHNRVVLVVAGLPPPEPGKTYQFWFATEKYQVPSHTFTVGDDGSAELLIDAPTRVDTYVEVMVTVEQDGGSQQPSGNVILAAKLSG